MNRVVRELLNSSTEERTLLEVRVGTDITKYRAMLQVQVQVALDLEQLVHRDYFVHDGRPGDNHHIDPGNKPRGAQHTKIGHLDAWAC